MGKEIRRGGGQGKLAGDDWIEHGGGPFEILDRDSEFKVQQEEELSLHEIDLGDGEGVGVSGPVLVLWRCVIEIFAIDWEGEGVA